MAAVSLAMGFGDFVCQQIEQSSHSGLDSGLTTASDRTILLWPSSEQGANLTRAASGEFFGDLMPLKSDVTAKNVATRRWNVSRSFRMAAVGLAVSGPLSHATYVGVARGLPDAGTAQRVLAIVLVAPVNLTATMASVGTLQGLSREGVWARVRRDVPPTWQLNAIFWPPALTLILNRVPLANRGAVGATFWFAWSIVLSLFANRTGEEGREESRAQGFGSAASAVQAASGEDVCGSEGGARATISGGGDGVDGERSDKKSAL